MTKREFVVRLKDQKSRKVYEHLVRKQTFAEAASEAYRFQHNLQFSIEPRGNWKIESISEYKLTGT